MERNERLLQISSWSAPQVFVPLGFFGFTKTVFIIWNGENDDLMICSKTEIDIILMIIDLNVGIPANVQPYYFLIWDLFDLLTAKWLSLIEALVFID